MVEYDSIIPPGRAGHITQEVDISKLHGESFKKSVSVVSNAVNAKGVLSLSVSGKIKPHIGISKHFIRLKDMDAGGEPFEMELRSEKKDLTIEEITFKTRDPSKSKTIWQTDLPTLVKHKLTRSDKPDKDGYYDYTLIITVESQVTESTHGEFVMATNHPKRDTIKLRGMIEVQK